MNTSIELTSQQEEAVAMAWIAKTCRHDYKKVLVAVFFSALTSSWAWNDALKFAVHYCSRNYFVDVSDILKGLK